MKIPPTTKCRRAEKERLGFYATMLGLLFYRLTFISQVFVGLRATLSQPRIYYYEADY